MSRKKSFDEDDDEPADAGTQALVRARRRVRELRNFYKLCFIYVAVNVFLWALNLTTRGPLWAHWVTLGWGLGVALKGIALVSDQKGWLFGRDWEERKVQELMARENLKVMSGEKKLVEAQLRLLQAQIEPHFLFNTLANVQSLIGRAPETASAMLDHFVTYLRQSLAASRNASGTLGQELDLIENYLQLLKMRMGGRLEFAIKVPPDLKPMPFAPMLLQPIVENAIKHGLEPKLEGGKLSVLVTREGSQCLIEVIDDGMGFSQNSDNGQISQAPSQNASGVGLSNLRERLALLYEGRASVKVSDQAPGTKVTLTLPIEMKL